MIVYLDLIPNINPKPSSGFPEWYDPDYDPNEFWEDEE